VIDEFQNFAYLETLSIMIAEGRKFGISLILSHQHTKQIPSDALGEILGNTASKIIFRVSGEDARRLARNLDITREKELVSALTSMPDGTAIVKLRAGFGEEPIEPFEIYTLKPLERRKVDLSAILEEMRSRYGSSLPPKPIQAPPRLGDKAIEILEAVDEVGDKGLGELSKTLGINPRRLKQSLEELERRGFVKISKRRGLVGRPRTTVLLTSKGKEAIGKPLGREGSLLHRMLLEKAARRFEELGWRVEIPRQGGRVEQPDLILRSETEVVAVEIETTAKYPKQVRRNYRKTWDTTE